MFIYFNIIGRQSDGLILTENQIDKCNETNLISAKHKTKQFLKNQSNNQDVRDLNCLEIDNAFNLNYMIADNVIYLILSDRKYPQKLARHLLKDIQTLFLEELQSHFGSGSVDYSSKIEMIEEPYYFTRQVKFERNIKKKINEFNDTRSEANTDRLKNDLNNLHSIMSENIDLVLNREKNLNKMSDKALRIKESSKLFKDRTQKLEWQYWLKANMIYMVLILLVLIFLYLKVF